VFATAAEITPAVALRRPARDPIVMFGAVRRPAELIDVVPVCPKNAVLDESTVEDAPPLSASKVVVAFPMNGYAKVETR
jgi:hypothetical protein